MFLEDLRHLVTLSGDGDRRADLRRLPPAELWDAVVALLGDADNVASKGRWALYWAMSEAVHELLPFMELGMHEPALTGILMANIRGSLRMSSSVNGGEIMAVHIADHQALWNESESGADFGLIVETIRGGSARYMTTLFQAKRMQRQRRGIDREQARKLDRSHIGAYLFYNEFAPAGREGILPTVKLASAAYAEVKNGRGVAAIDGAHDFALAVAFSTPSRISAIGAEYATPEEAILALFDVELEQQLNHILVTSVGEHRIPIEQIVRHERRWRALVQRAIFNRSQGRAPFVDGPENPPPGFG